MTDLALQPATELMTPALSELAQLDQWVISRLVKGQKPPFSPHTRRQCSHSNPEHWSSYQTACTALPGFDWLGFVFHDSDPYSGVDLDGCRDKDTGAIEGWAQRIIDMCDSYSEISPSETGVKIFVRGTLPEQLTHSLGAHKGIEIYSTRRYFTFTGQHLAGTPAEIRDAQPALDLLWKEYHKEPEPAAPRKEYKVSKGEAANDRQNARDVIERLNRANDLGDLLEHHGGTRIGKRSEPRHYSGLNGDKHSNALTYTVSKARNGGYIGYSQSPNGKLNKDDFSHGFDWFTAYVVLEYGSYTSENRIAALKKLNPIQPREPHQQPAQPATEYRTAQQDADAERRRAERRADATATRDKIAARALSDDRLTSCDRATLQAMLDWAAEHHSASCWAGRGTIAQRAGYSLGSVKRSTMLLEHYGYFTSEGSGGAFYHTAKRTFTCGSYFADETIVNAKDDPRIDPVACEGGLAPALEEIAPIAQQEAETDEFTLATDDTPLDMDEIDRMVAEIQTAQNDLETHRKAPFVPHFVLAVNASERHEPQNYWDKHEARAWSEAHPVPPMPVAVVNQQEAKNEANKARKRAKWDAMGDNPHALGRELGVLRNYLKSHPSAIWPRWQITELNDRIAALTPVSEAVDSPPSQAPARRPAPTAPAVLQPDLFADAPPQNPYYIAALGLADRLRALQQAQP